MRDTIGIICAVQNCEPVTEEELRLALVVISQWAGTAWRFLVEAERDEQTLPAIKSMAGHLAKSYWTTVKAPPDKFLGERYTPGTELNKKCVDEAKKLFKKATGVDL